MNILAIDIGSYAVKYAFCSLERKKLTLIRHGLVIIDEVKKDLPEETLHEDVQLSIIKSFMQDFPDAKVITHLPIDLVTTRYISLPVNNKKKAEMMIPFQLDENLPFEVSKSHYTSFIQKVGDQCEAQVSVTPIESFRPFYLKLKESNILPHLMASDLAFMQSYCDQSPLSGSYAIIDIGHQFTNGYFIHNKNIISNHVSYIAGSVIDEVISETYEIPLNEAVTYKHQNCFLLTDSQYDSVNKDQKEFALLMKQIFTPLIQDLKRWELGFRVNYGRPVDKIYITGGTSQINNINNFLSIELGLKVEHLPEPHNFNADEDVIAESGNLLSSSFLMLASQRSKLPPMNMLKGDFGGTLSKGVPLYSSSFILSRAAILLLVLSVFIGLQNIFFLKSEEKKLNVKVRRILKKNKNLKLTNSQRRLYSKKPERLLKIIKKKTGQAKKEFITIKKASSINALKPLEEIHAYLSKNENIHLTLFESAKQKVKIRFESENPDEVNVLASVLRGIPLKNKKVLYKKGKREITVTFDEAL